MMFFAPYSSYSVEITYTEKPIDRAVGSLADILADTAKKAIGAPDTVSEKNKSEENPNSDAAVNNQDNKEADAQQGKNIPQVDVVDEKKVPAKLPETNAHKTPSFPLTSITGSEAKNHDGIHGDKEGSYLRFFVKGKKNTAQNEDEKRKVNNAEDEDGIVVVLPRPVKEVVPGLLKPGQEPSPYQRPDNNYRTQLLPSSVSKKEYSRENQHLPKAVYNVEYKKILFDSAAAGNLDVLRAMVAEFGDTEILDKEGNTPLIYAAMAGNLQSVITLISLGANVDASNFTGVSALYAATKLGRIDIVIYLATRVTNPDDADINNKTPLMIAAEMDYSRIATVLLKRGANIDNRMLDGTSAMHLAAKKGSLATMNLLLTKGADTDVRNIEGETPLMMAVRAGKEQAVVLLLKAGASLTIRNIRGENAEKIAEMGRNFNIVEILESEKIRRDLLVDKLIEARKDRIEEEVLPIDPDKMVAKRNKGIPLPIIKPDMRALQPARAPHPSFTKEEMQKMNNGGF